MSLGLGILGRVLDAKEVASWGLPPLAWEVTGWSLFVAIVCVIVIGYGRRHHKEINELRNLVAAKGMDTSKPEVQDIIFWVTREQFDKSTQARLIDKAEVIWAWWCTGEQTKSSTKHLRWKIRRLLLADPNGETFAELFELTRRDKPSTAEINECKLEVKSLTKRVMASASKQRKLEGDEGVWWTTTIPPHLITIGNPDESDAWAFVQVLPLFTYGDDRPCYLVYKASNEQLFTKIRKIFQSQWFNEDETRKPLPEEYEGAND